MTQTTQYPPAETQSTEAYDDKAPQVLLQIAKSLESEHYGHYVMINTTSQDYVVAPTISAVHSQFIETFGWEAPGYCLRIGASPFAAA